MSLYWVLRSSTLFLKSLVRAATRLQWLLCRMDRPSLADLLRQNFGC